jgi:hypothetical protein
VEYMPYKLKCQVQGFISVFQNWVQERVGVELGSGACRGGTVCQPHSMCVGVWGHTECLRGTQQY